MSERSSKLKKRLRQGETTFGGWLTVPHPMIAEIMAGAGFDWVMIDTEHGGFSNEGLQTLPCRLQRLTHGTDGPEWPGTMRF